MKKPKTLWIITAVILLINLFIYLFKPGGEKLLLYVSDFLPVLCAIITICYLCLAVMSFKELDYTKMAWIMILIGIIFYLFGETTYAIVEIFFPDIAEDYPGYADYLWCFGYIPLFIGLSMIFIGYKKSGMPMGSGKLHFVLPLLVFIITAAVIYFLLIPVMSDPETATIEKVFYMFYPIGDILIVIPAVVLIIIVSQFGAAAITRPWKYLALGFVLFTISDILYSYLDWMGMYGDGNLIDLGWNGGYLLLAFAGLNQIRLAESLKK